MTAEREILHRFNVQPGLDVAVEDSLNILLLITTPDGTCELARSDALSNADDLKNALDLARTWVAGAEDDARSERVMTLNRKMTRL